MKGSSLLTNSCSISTPPLVLSILSVLSHTHTLAPCSSSPLPLAGRSPRASPHTGLSATAQKAESLHLIGTPAPSGCHSGSHTAFSSLFLHFLPLPPLLFSTYTCHANNRGQCTSLPCAIMSLGAVGFSNEEAYFGVLWCVLQGPPTYRGNPKSWGGLWMFSVGSDSFAYTFASVSHLKVLCNNDSH